MSENLFETDEPNKEYILNNLREEDIFRFYLGVRPEVGIWITNPLRSDDESPGCNFYWDKQGRLKFHDWGRDWNWDVFNLVQYLYQCSFRKACWIIAKDMRLLANGGSLTPIERPVLLDETPLEIRVKTRRMTKIELEFWNSFSVKVTEAELNEFGIFGLEATWFNGRLKYQHDKRKLAFVYCFGGYDYKLYFPKEHPKFYHATPGLMQGARLLPETGNHLVITKSFKDVFFLHKFGVNAVAPMSETILPTPLQFERMYSRFEKLYSLYDRDYIGIKKTNEMKRKYGVIPLMFEKGEPKDFSDNLQVYGERDMAEMVEYYKNLLL